MLFTSVEPLVSTQICERLLLFPALGVGFLFTILPNCVVALRLYALYERNTKLGLALSLFILAEVGVGLWLDLTPSVTRIDVFSALGYPELNNVPAMRLIYFSLPSPAFNQIDSHLNILHSNFAGNL